MLRTILALLLIALAVAIAQQPAVEMRAGQVGVALSGPFDQQVINFQEGVTNVHLSASGTGTLTVQSADGTGPIVIEFANGSIKKMCQEFGNGSTR